METEFDAILLEKLKNGADVTDSNQNEDIIYLYNEDIGEAADIYISKDTPHFKIKYTLIKEDEEADESIETEYEFEGDTLISTLEKMYQFFKDNHIRTWLWLDYVNKESPILIP